MSRKTRKLIWSAPLVAVLAVAGALAIFVALGPGSVFANPLPGAPSNLGSGSCLRRCRADHPGAGLGRRGRATGYRIDISNRGGVWETMMDGITPAAPRPLTPTAACSTAGDTRWYYRVFAVNDHGAGSGIQSGNSGTTDQPRSTPPSVMNLRATAQREQPAAKIDLSWDAPAENGGAPIVGY